MSDLAVAPVEEDQRSDESTWVWHHAASWQDFCAAMRGEPYTAMCGRRCRNPQRILRHKDKLSPIQKCVVCREVAGS